MDDIEAMKDEIRRLHDTLGTLISWLPLELGKKSAQELHEMLGPLHPNLRGRRNGPIDDDHRYMEAIGWTRADLECISGEKANAYTYMTTTGLLAFPTALIPFVRSLKAQWAAGTSRWSVGRPDAVEVYTNQEFIALCEQERCGGRTEEP